MEHTLESASREFSTEGNVERREGPIISELNTVLVSLNRAAAEEAEPPEEAELEAACGVEVRSFSGVFESGLNAPMNAGSIEFGVTGTSAIDADEHNDDWLLAAAAGESNAAIALKGIIS